MLTFDSSVPYKNKIGNDSFAKEENNLWHFVKYYESFDIFFDNQHSDYNKHIISGWNRKEF